jgi:hypothetical protein
MGNDTTYHLEFKLPCISQCLDLPIPPEVLGAGLSTGTSANTAISDEVAHSKVHPAAAQGQNKRRKWTRKENATILRMKEDGHSWDDIHAALPHRTKGTIQVHYCTKLKK